MTIFMQFTSSKTIATLGDDGFWTVVGDITSGKQIKGEELETRTISTKSIDKILDKAFETVSRALMAKFTDVNSNLFNIPKELNGQYIPHPLESN